jgi:hypothetical protein
VALVSRFQSSTATVESSAEDRSPAASRKSECGFDRFLDDHVCPPPECKAGGCGGWYRTLGQILDHRQQVTTSIDEDAAANSRDGDKRMSPG